MGFCLILPYFETAEAATRNTATKKSSTARLSQSSAKRVSSLEQQHQARPPLFADARASARRVRLARAKAAAYARDMRVLQTPQYRTDANGMQVPDVRAEAAIIYNPVTHEVLWEENSQSSRSIASITKVMTAVVFLEHASNTRLRD